MSNVLPCQVKFTILNKEPAAQRQRAHCLESAAGKGWRQSQVCLSVRLRLPSWGGRELMRPLLGNSPETPAIGLLNQQHVQCTSRRGIWHLNFPWTFPHHHLQLLHMWAASSCREIFQGRPAERGRVSSWASAWGSLTQQTRSRGLPSVCLCLCMQRRPPRQASTKPCGWMSFCLKASVLSGLIPRVALLEEVRPLGDGLVTGIRQIGSSNHGPEVP